MTSSPTNASTAEVAKELFMFLRVLQSSSKVSLISAAFDHHISPMSKEAVATVDPRTLAPWSRMIKPPAFDKMKNEDEILAAYDVS